MTVARFVRSRAAACARVTRGSEHRMAIVMVHRENRLLPIARSTVAAPSPRLAIACIGLIDRRSGSGTLILENSSSFQDLQSQGSYFVKMNAQRRALEVDIVNARLRGYETRLIETIADGLGRFAVVPDAR